MTYLTLHHVTGVKVMKDTNPDVVHLDIKGKQEIDITLFFDTEKEKEDFMMELNSVKTRGEIWKNSIVFLKVTRL